MARLKEKYKRNSAGCGINAPGHRRPLADAIYNSHLVHIVGGPCISSGMNSMAND